jgi:hypothetical protein
MHPLARSPHALLATRPPGGARPLCRALLDGAALRFAPALAALIAACGTPAASSTDGGTRLPASSDMQASLSSGEPIAPDPNAIPPTLFGLHIHHADSATPWPASAFGSFRLWDAFVAWPSLEPEPGVWEWAALDKDVALAEQRGVDVLLPLALSPTWASARPTEPSVYQPGNAAEPADLAEWRDYVRTVGTRYRGRIHYYEIWNEPNLPAFYTGTVDTMVQLAQVARSTLLAIDPTIRIVSPSTTENDTKWIDSFFRKGGAALVDVVGYHFYTWPTGPENMLPTIARVREVMVHHGLAGVPLWNTEAGWRVANRLGPPSVGENDAISIDTMSGFVARAYALQWWSGLDRFFLYGWDGPSMALTEANGVTVKACGVAYDEAYHWLVGARLDACTRDSNQTWTCSLTRPDGYGGWMVWNTNQTVDFPVPPAWGATRYRDLAGAISSLEGATLAVGPKPLLLERP